MPPTDADVAHLHTEHSTYLFEAAAEQIIAAHAAENTRRAAALAQQVGLQRFNAD